MVIVTCYLETKPSVHPHVYHSTAQRHPYHHHFLKHCQCRVPSAVDHVLHRRGHHFEEMNAR